MGEAWLRGSLGDECREGVQDYRDILREHQERRNHGASVAMLPLSEKYLRNDLCVIVELNRNPVANAEVAGFSDIAGVEDHGLKIHDRLPFVVDGASASDATGGDDRGQNGVLIPVVEEVHLVDGRVLSTRKNLKVDEELLGVIAGCFESATRGYVALPIGPGREFGVAVLCSFVQTHELPGGMIEGATEIVDYVSDEEAQFERNGFSEFQLNEGPALSVTINGDTVRATLNKGLESAFQLVDVFFGPCHLGASTHEHV